MKLTIFGATGRTGLEIVRLAVEKKYDVTVFVRNPEKLGLIKNKVRVIKGDIMSQTDVLSAVKGSDVVICALGPTKDSAPGFQPAATTLIIKAMNQAKVSRLISMTGAGVHVKGDRPGFVDKAIVSVMNLIAKKILSDGQEHARIVMESQLDWTIVRAPMLRSGPAKNSFTHGVVGDKELKPFINRSDVAVFILDIIGKKDFVRAAPVVADAK